MMPYLHNRDERRVQVVGLRFSGVEDLHRKGSPWNGKDGGLEEVLGELDGIQGGRSDDKLELWSQADGLLQQAKEHVGGDSALVSFVEHYAGVGSGAAAQ